MGVEQGISDQDLFIVLNQKVFPVKDYPSDTIGSFGYDLCIEVADVFMPFGFVMFPLIFMDPKVKFGLVLDDGFVERGKQHMFITIQPGNRTYQKSVILPGVTSRNGGTNVRTGPVRTEKLTGERIFQVNQTTFIKL